MRNQSMWKSKRAYGVLVGKHEGRRPLGRHRSTWEDNIKTNLRDVGWWGTDWINPAENRNTWRAFVNAIMKLRVP
jgi:hypothetical protein